MTPLRHGMSRLAVRFAALTAFLLPLKFGGLAGVPELSSFYPPGVLDWLVVSWPVQFFPVVPHLGNGPHAVVVEAQHADQAEDIGDAPGL